jgi:stage II sporulation protein D
MLHSGIIPETEPSIRVGIVLPQDGLNRIELEIPTAGIYTIKTPAGNKTLKNGKIIIEQNNQKIKCSGEEIPATLKIAPQHSSPIKPTSGIKIFAVPAGRGFHWQKVIDIHLPGNLEFSIYEGHLLLVNELPLEQYLACVATAEMSAVCPPAFLEAQTIAARSWMLANVEKKHAQLGFDLCNDDCCQRYQGSGNLTDQSIRGAELTRGQVLIYKNRICDARYSKSCGGITERSSTIWGGPDADYLQVLADTDPAASTRITPLDSEQRVHDWIAQVPLTYCSSRTVAENNLHAYLGKVDEQGKYFRWQVRYTQKEIGSLLNERLGIEARAILDCIPLERGGSGRLIRLQINYLDTAGEKTQTLVEGDINIRRALHKGFLYSSCIYFSKRSGAAEIPEEFTIYGAGWGHGVGLCQIGALGMALQDCTAKEILAHYYPRSLLTKIYK